MKRDFPQALHRLESWFAANGWQAFDFQRDVPICAGARDGTCLSAAQKTAIASVFGGVVLSDGTPIYSSQPWDPGLLSAGLISWHFQSPVGLSGGNTPNNWALQQSLNSGVAYPAVPTWNAAGVMNSYGPAWAAGSVDSALVGIGNDVNIPSIARVLDGTAAFRVNDPATGAHLSRIYQTITVPTSISVPKLTFYWAAVLQDPAHAPADQPYVDVLIQDVTDAANVSTVYFKHFYGGDPSYPGWIIGANSWKGIPWQKVNLANLVAYRGHKLKITVTAADCTQGGHGGYAYLDNIGCN